MATAAPRSLHAILSGRLPVVAPPMSATGPRFQLRAPASAIYRIGLLLLVALLPRGLLWFRTVGPAKDAVRYFTAAEHLEAGRWRHIECPPMFPLFLSFVHRATQFFGRPDPWSWFRAAQLANIAIYCGFLLATLEIGTRLVGRDKAWWASLAIAILPRQAWYSCDILGDALFAAFYMAALACLLRGFEEGRLVDWAGAGAAAGLAVLTRLEACLLPLVLSAAIVLHMMRDRWRWRIAGIVLRMALFSVPFLILVSGWYGARGVRSPSASASAMAGTMTLPQRRVEWTTGPAGDRLMRGPHYGEIETTTDREKSPAPTLDEATIGGATIRALAEAAQECRGWLIILAIPAIFSCSWRRWSRGQLLAVLLVLGTLALLVAVRIRVGFLSSRYWTPVLPLLSLAAMAGAERMGNGIAAAIRWCRSKLFGASSGADWQISHWLTGASMLAIGLGLSVPGWFERLHSRRHGLVQAGLWAREQRPAVVWDPTGTATFFAGTLSNPAGHHYAVVERSATVRYDAASEATAWVIEKGKIRKAFPARAHDPEPGVFVIELPSPANGGAP